MSPMVRVRPFLSAVGVLALLAPAASAQERRSEIAVAGEVTDAGTGAPIANAVVRVLTAERTAFTNPAGRFRIDGLQPGTHLFEVQRLGYRTFRFDAEFEEDTPVFVELFADPILLEGLTVATDRFGQRLRFLPYRASVWTGDDLRAYHLTDTKMFLADRSPWIECVVGDRAEPTMICRTMVGGRLRTLRVFIDDSAVPREWAELDALPLDRIHRIEFVRSCAMVRVYTNTYVERVARGEARLSRSFSGDCQMVCRELGLSC